MKQILRTLGRFFARVPFIPRKLRSPMGSRYVTALLAILLVGVVFTYSVTLTGKYPLVYNPDITLNPELSVKQVRDAMSDRFEYFLALFGSLAIGFLLAHLFQVAKRRLMTHPANQADPEQRLLISQTIWEAFKENVAEGLLIALIAIVVLYNFAVWSGSFEGVRTFRLGSAAAAFAFTLLSIAITTIGMHYAFVAQREASAAKDAAELRAFYMRGFDRFLSRINRKISSDSHALDSICTNLDASLHGDESHFYQVDCMFLTPFLGHAGLRERYEHAELARKFERFQVHLANLINHGFCDVRMLTLKDKKLVGWYAQVAWIEAAKETKVDDMTKKKKNEILEEVKEQLKTKGQRHMQINGGPTIKSFTQLAADYESHFRGTKDTPFGVRPRLRICQNDYIPFQLFLARERDIRMKAEKGQSSGAESRLYRGDQFAVVTLVGDETYRKLIDDLFQRREGLQSTAGIEGLLENLHAALYTEDPRICDMLGNHFEHYWAETTQAGTSSASHSVKVDAPRENRHYPDVDFELWENIKLDDFLPDSCFAHPESETQKVTLVKDEGHEEGA